LVTLAQHDRGVRALHDVAHPGGSVTILAAEVSAANRPGLVLHRLTQTGEPDPSYGTGGNVEFAAVSSNTTASVHVRDSGALLVFESIASIYVLRAADLSGQIDTGFGQDGVVTFTAPSPSPSISVIANPAHLYRCARMRINPTRWSDWIDLH
jgi:hypothetical protein